jgi:hypothetical protein
LGHGFLQQISLRETIQLVHGPQTPGKTRSLTQ